MFAIQVWLQSISMRLALLTAIAFLPFIGKAQKIENIFFNLYTDSLKKGVYNYINIDGKDSNGKFMPLMSDAIEFTSTCGKWEGNSLVIDTSNKADSVVISACLKSNRSLLKTITLYFKRKEDNAILPTEKELIDKWQKKKKN